MLNLSDEEVQLELTGWILQTSSSHSEAQHLGVGTQATVKWVQLFMGAYQVRLLPHQ